MSLNQMASNPHATNGSAKDEAEAEARVHLKDVGVEGLDCSAHSLIKVVNKSLTTALVRR